MAKLTASERKKLPDSDFAGPGRSYPVNDKNHAIAAKSRAAQFASPAEKAKIDVKANKVLGEKKCSKCGKPMSQCTCAKPSAKVDHAAMAAKHTVQADIHRAMADKHVAAGKMQALAGGAKPQISEWGGVSIPVQGAKAVKK